MPDAPNEPERRFRALFDRWSRRVRRRLALEVIFTGAALGTALGAAGAVAAWQTRHGALRPWMAAGGLVGAAAGVAVARRRRWSDPTVALYLDAKLGAEEAVSTAVELTQDAATAREARAVVLAQATAALSSATPAKVRAPMWRPWHATAPLAAVAIGYLSWLPLPPLPAAAAPPPGADALRLAEIAGLEKILRLSEIDARDPAQRERLNKLSEEAKRLREKLRRGVERREALADIGSLRDAIAAERLSLGEGEQRQGMESALGRLGENRDLRRAAKALGDRDLVAFDEEMERLANTLEREDRERARKTLEDAQEAARRAGAPGVAKALEEQRRLLEERARRTEKLRDLAQALGEALGEEGQQALGDLTRSGSGKDAQRLAESLEKVLGKLSPEERKRLAERLKQQVAGAPDPSPGGALSEEQLKELAEQLMTLEGQRELEEQLRRMAQDGGPESGEAERQEALEDAQRGAGEAEGQLGGVPLPMAGAGQAGTPGGRGQSKTGNGPGQAGHSDGGGHGDHAGQTVAIPGDAVRSRAETRINPGKPMPGTVMGRTAGRAGETANVQGEGALGAVGPEELGGIERSEVPEEYREQVGRYFQPR